MSLVRHPHSLLARLLPVLLAALVLCLGPFLGGCASPGSQLTGDNIADIRNPALKSQSRIMALDQLWGESANDPELRKHSRAMLKDLVWDYATTPTDLRLKIMEKLFSDTSEENLADTRKLARLMIPKEPSRTMMVYLCSVAGARGYIDFTGALIRSYSRPEPLVPDTERSERGALAALYPDRPVERTVYESFIHPPPMDDIPGLDATQRMRSEAWDLMGRLDPSGSFRLRALAETNVPPEDAELNAIQRAAREAKAIPISGGEIPWLVSLVSADNAENAAWWSEATSAVARLNEEQQRGLCLRHLEPIRWATANRSQWLNASRQALLAELERRLEDRHTHRRAADAQANRKPVRQNLETWQGKLSYGDLLSILVIDDAVREKKIMLSLFQQQDLDYNDKQTEYGGIIDYSGAAGTMEKTWSGEEKPADHSWRARLFAPRSSQRYADDQFIASVDMMNASDRSLAIYHFHAQRYRNDDFAGPSDGDHEFATMCGRSCIVLTSIREGTLNVDYYQGNGAVLDLGEIVKP